VTLGRLKYIQLYITLDIYQVPVEFPQVSGRAVHKLVNSICNKEQLSQQQKERIIELIGEKVDGKRL